MRTTRCAPPFASTPVTPQDLDAAEAVERGLPRIGLPAQDPPLDNHHCICPKYYPDFFPPAPLGAHVEEPRE